MGVAGQVGAFGEELTGETIPVLVRSSLPRRVRVTEVDVDAGCDGELGVVGEFTTLVPRQRLGELVGETLHLDSEPIGDVSRGTIIDFDETPISGGAFHDGRHRGLAGLADHQVAFPVAGDGTVLDLGGSLGDVDHVLDLALPGVDPALRLAPGPARTQTPGELFA